MILISCVKFGYSDLAGDARFQIRGSIFVGNSNDLALQLTVAMTEFIFLFYLKGIGKRLLGFAGIVLCLFYMLKTGSRGCVLALAVVSIITFILSKQKLRMIIVAVPLLAVAIALMPSSSAHRLLTVFSSTSAADTPGSD